MTDQLRPEPTAGEVWELDQIADITKKRLLLGGDDMPDALDAAVKARSEWRDRQIAEQGVAGAMQKRIDEIDSQRKAIEETKTVKRSREELEAIGAQVPKPVAPPVITAPTTSGTPTVIIPVQPAVPYDLSQKPKPDRLDREILRRRSGKKGKANEKRADDQLTEKQMKDLMVQSGIIFDGLPLNKDGHARRLLNAAQDEMRFIVRPNGGYWIVYDQSGQWTTDAAPQRIGAHITKLAYKMLEWANQAEAKVLEPGLTADEIDDFKRLVLRLRNEHRSILGNIPSITRQTSYIPESHIREDAFDVDPYRVAVLNGVLDLNTGKLTKHAPGNFVRRMLQVTYDPKAQAPTFLKVFNEALADINGDNLAPVRAWVQMFAGSLLTADIREQLSLWNLGPGGTGKSSIWGTIADVLGSWAVRAPKGLLRVGYDGRFADADTVGKRMVLDSEWKEHQRIKTDSFLRITGERFHTPEVKNMQSVQRPITHKLVIVANNPPVWDATDDSTVSAMERRIAMVRYEHPVQIVGDNYLVVSEALTQEWDGVFAWLVAGCRKWLKTPLRPAEPAIMVRWREDYISSLGVVDPIEDGLSKAGYAWDRPLTEYSWSSDILDDVNKVMDDEMRILISREALAAKLTEMGLTKKRKRKQGESNATYVWHGISK